MGIVCDDCSLTFPKDYPCNVPFETKFWSRNNHTKSKSNQHSQPQTSFSSLPNADKQNRRNGESTTSRQNPKPCILTNSKSYLILINAPTVARSCPSIIPEPKGFRSNLSHERMIHLLWIARFALPEQCRWMEERPWMLWELCKMRSIGSNRERRQQSFFRAKGATLEPGPDHPESPPQLQLPCPAALRSLYLNW